MHGRRIAMTDGQRKVKSEKKQVLRTEGKIISNNVGQGLAPAEIINEYMITNGCYQIKFDIIP